MPTFDTPNPIRATIDIVSGHVRVSAGDRRDTLVEIQPSDASKKDDVEAAERTRVEFANQQLLVKAPKLRSWSWRSTGGAIEVAIELPAGSHLQGTAQLADFQCDGRFGDCRIKTGLGHIRLDRADTLSLKSGMGDISVDRGTAHTDVKAGSGDVRLRELDSSAVIKNSNGDTWVGVAGGDLRVGAANGSIAVDLAHATVAAKTANGHVRLGEVERGSVVLETSAGNLEVGIPEGTAAWLDVNTTAGKVRNALDAADAPGPAAETVEVRARTSFGNILIRRPLTSDRQPAAQGETP
jgi:DUF4097 and DUF4098 domain-containing protein YvlB